MVQPFVAAVSRNDAHAFSKPVRDEIELVAGLGVAGDVHAGFTVRHRSRVAADPGQPNLRQVHLIHGELFAEVGEQGFRVSPGELGENVTTTGLDLLGLPRGAVLRFGPDRPGPLPVPPGVLDPVLAAAAESTLDDATAAAVSALKATLARVAAGAGPSGAGSEGSRSGGAVVVVTGLRNPCAQINNFQSGLLKQVIGQDDDGNAVRKGGIMAVVLVGGRIRPGDPITVELPPPPHLPLERV
jgi:MOSC domain-containing protein YiiM